jgi:NAD(P)-dependent dehydrogenase (short-subunit alcohol dehydrogenase family)
MTGQSNESAQTLAGRVAIVSGATGGLGVTVSEALARAGARLTLAGHRQGPLDELASRLATEHGVATQAVGADLARSDGAQRVVAATVQRWGRLDILVNLAGGFAGGKPVAETADEELERMLDLNLRTAWCLARAAVPAMASAGWGRIVNVGARDALAGRAGFAAYGISKAGVLRLTEALAAETRDHGITANAILPSLIDTAANRNAMPDADFRRWVSPAAIAETILFLCGDGAGAAISGAAIPLFGRS